MNVHRTETEKEKRDTRKKPCEDGVRYWSDTCINQKLLKLPESQPPECRREV